MKKVLLFNLIKCMWINVWSVWTSCNQIHKINEQHVIQYTKFYQKYELNVIKCMKCYQMYEVMWSSAGCVIKCTKCTHMVGILKWAHGTEEIYHLSLSLTISYIYYALYLCYNINSLTFYLYFNHNIRVLYL